MAGLAHLLKGGFHGVMVSTQDSESCDPSSNLFSTKVCPAPKKDVHRPGIEPGPPAWQASILPLNQRCFLLGALTKLLRSR